MAAKKHLFSWSGYAVKKLVSAVVANASAQNIVLTFTDIKPFKNCVYGDFTTSGTVKTVDSRTLNYTNNTVTVHVTSGFTSGQSINVVYNPSTPKGATVTIPVTNNVL